MNEQANMAAHYEHEIPEGYEARIEGNKVVIEPKGSEDEKIRKNLIELLLDTPAQDIISHHLELSKVLAYLERQKYERKLGFIEGKVKCVRQIYQEIKDAMSLFEPKDLTPFEFTFRDYIDSAIRYCLSGEGYQQYIKEWAADLLNLERQKEQKPADQGVKGRRGRIGGTPEHIRKEAENFLSKMEPPYDADDICSAYETGAMESIKQEWSEEDEKILKDCIDMPYSADFISMERKKDAIRWLKSLRPQPHWKPSEEQMRCLLDCVSKAKEIHNASVGGYDAYRILVSLYDELHKLL